MYKGPPVCQKRGHNILQPRHICTGAALFQFILKIRFNNPRNALGDFITTIFISAHPPPISCRCSLFPCSLRLLPTPKLQYWWGPAIPPCRLYKRRPGPGIPSFPRITKCRLLPHLDIPVYEGRRPMVQYLLVTFKLMSLTQRFALPVGNFFCLLIKPNVAFVPAECNFPLF